MRICFLSAGSFAHVGAYLEYFQDAGHDVHFLALSPSPPRRVATHQLGSGPLSNADPSKWRYPGSMLRARAAVRRLAPDIVHAHYATSGGLAGLVCGFRPTIVTAHGTDLTAGARSPVWRPLLRAVFGHADCVNTVSDGLKALAVGLGVDEKKISVLTPGVDTRAFACQRPALDERRPLRLLCTRRLEPVYDLPCVLHALAMLRARGLRFSATIAGDGALRGDLERLAASLDLGAQVSFIGAVAHEGMPALLREHDVYLSASRSDGTSLSLLEAMASGIFPIVSDIPANRAWLDDGEGGLLHSPADAEDLARRVLEFAARRELAARAARLNAARVAERGDRRTNMRRLENLYAELIARRRRS